MTKNFFLMILLFFALVKNSWAISGPTNVCNGAQTVGYSTSVQASNYAWYRDGTMVSSGASSCTTTFPSETSETTYTIKVEFYDSKNNFTGSETLSVTVEGMPAKPVFQASSGLTNQAYIPCGSTNQYTYAVNNVSGVSYSWYIPSFNYTTGTNSSVVSGTFSWPADTSNPVSVAAVKGGNWVNNNEYFCPVKVSDLATIRLKTTPNAPTWITAPTSADRGQTKNYQINTVPDATSYTWTASGYASPTITGSGTSASVIFANKGTATISVKANNACGIGSAATVNVNVTCNNPSNPVTVCPTTTGLSNNFGVSGGWTSQNSYYRTLADVSGDLNKDIVGFSPSVGVVVSKYNGSTFDPASIWLNDFKWSNFTNNPRILANIDNSGGDDIIGFWTDGVYLSLSTNSSFAAKTKIVNDFGSNAGWNENTTPRFVIDVDGDLDKDIVGFGNAGVLVAINNGGTFATPTYWINNFSTNAGWSDVSTYPRFLANIVGDAKPDIIGFSDNYVYVSENKGSYFATPAIWYSGFGSTAGYLNNNEYPRFIADMDNNGYGDIIAFGESDVCVALTNNTGTACFPHTRWATDYGKTQGNTSQANYPRFLAHVNNDQLLDVVSFGQDQIGIGINVSGTSFDCNQAGSWGFVRGEGWDSQSTYPRFVTNIEGPTGDNRDEIVGFGSQNVYMHNCNSSYNTFKMGASEEEIVTLSFTASPNPSNGQMEFVYNLQEEGSVSLTIVDVMGNKMKDIKIGTREVGKSTEYVNLSDLNTGTYTCILNVNGVSTNYKKIIIVK